MMRCRLAHWDAIQNDKRFPEVLTVLKSHGFEPGDTSGSHYLSKALQFTKDQTKDKNRRVWQAVMMIRGVDYLEKMVLRSAH